NTDLTSGVIVVSTQAGLPADGKFETYDVITDIDGETIENKSDLQSALYKHQVGDTITITYYRNNKKQTVDIKLTHSTDQLQ
ncbi:PDZ domain-containing protein, partial [Streptococcus suis]